MHLFPAQTAIQPGPDVPADRLDPPQAIRIDQGPSRRTAPSVQVVERVNVGRASSTHA